MTRQIYAGPVAIGGGAPVSIQSMLNTRTTDVEGSLRQIRQLAAAGCEIARLAIPDMDAAHAFREICAESPLPLVADETAPAQPETPETPEQSGPDDTIGTDFWN